MECFEWQAIYTLDVRSFLQHCRSTQWKLPPLGRHDKILSENKLMLRCCEDSCHFSAFCECLDLLTNSTACLIFLRRPTVIADKRSTSTSLSIPDILLNYWTLLLNVQCLFTERCVSFWKKNWRESLQCSRRVSELESNCKHVERFSYATSRANYGNRAAVCCLLKGGKNAPRKQHVSRFPKDISVTANRCYLLWSIMAADGCRQTNYARWKVVRTVAEYSMAGQYRFVPLGRHLVLFHVFYFGNGYTVLKTTCVNRHFGYMESFRVCLQKWMLLIPIFLLTNCKHYTEEIGVQVSYQQFCSVPSYVHTSKIKLNIDIHNDSKISLNGVNLMTVIRSNNWNVILKQIEVRNAASECRGVIK